MKAITYEDGGAPQEAAEAEMMGGNGQPAAGRRDRSARFWDRIAERYARKPVADEAAYQKKLDVSRRYFSPDMEVMEFGCGTGSTAIAHAPYVKHIRATDISAKMIEIARRKAHAAGIGNVTFEQSTIEDLQAPARSLDAVLALNILHLLADKEAAIAKVRDMLKPGGVFVTSTVCLGGRMAWFRCVAPIGKALGLIPLVKFITEEDLRQSLKRAGFEIAYDWRHAKGIAVFIIAKKIED